MPYLISLLLLLPALLSAAPQPPVIHHDLNVRLSPEESTLEVTDRITLPEDRKHFRFLLHDGLAPRVSTAGATLSAGRRHQSRVPARDYLIRLEKPSRELIVHYRGSISHSLEKHSQNYANGRASSPGDISADGAFLSASTLWFPYADQHLISFSLRVAVPGDWRVVSQGDPLAEGDGWREDAPQDDIYLVAGPYHLYQRPTLRARETITPCFGTPIHPAWRRCENLKDNEYYCVSAPCQTGASTPQNQELTISRALNVQAQVYLRTPDPALADRYLAATEHYLALYSRLIGPYPYAKFALVENSWESGYGMPSFTLLGPRVIRLPFILHSSYPHEILHNWWGNGVYVDYASGNWSEGLTSYLADHLIREQRGGGSVYRRETLAHYANFVRESTDFSLVDFRGHHGEASQAVGYGKTLMFIHMLRMRLGDEDFRAGLQRFYRDNLFHNAGFNDLKKALESVSGKDLDDEFEQWTRRTGAPALQLDSVEVARSGKHFQLQGRLRQIQEATPFLLRIPVYIQTTSGSTPLLRTLEMKGRELSFDLRFEERPVRISIDPGFDLFRRLAPGETPSSLGQLFGADRLSIILPDAAERSLKQSYTALAEAWSGENPAVRVLWDRELKQLPEGYVWLFGRENRFLPELLRQLRDQPVTLGQKNLVIGEPGEEKEFSVDRHSFALTAIHPKGSESSIGLLSLDSPDAMRGLARKLPHYNKYGYTVFSGKQPVNQLKGKWKSSASALTVSLVDKGELPSLSVPEHLPLIR